MKNVPRKCPVCKRALSWSKGGNIECFSNRHFFAHVDKKHGIDFYEVNLEVDGTVYNLSGQNFEDSVTELRDESNRMMTIVDTFYPYVTGKFINNSLRIIDKLLKLKSFY